jgi:hypothetical protein
VGQFRRFRTGAFVHPAMTRPDRVRVEQLADQMKPAALQEIRSTLGEFVPDQLTAFEIVAMLSVLRSARARIEAEQAPPAPVLQLIPVGTR